MNTNASETKTKVIKVFTWSDNAEMWVARSIRNKVDGVITDDPRRFVELCDAWGCDEPREVRGGFGGWEFWEVLFWVGIGLYVWFLEILEGLGLGWGW